MSGTWRLLVDPPASGEWNMAVDEALLLDCAESGPTLRLYTWDTPTVSLGYRQERLGWLDRAQGRRGRGVPVVRRVTGGGAVLHGGDLTYAVVAPTGCPDVPADLHGSYLWIRSVLLRGLHELGLDAAPARPTPRAEREGVCFAGRTGLEIELERAKVVGSAQRRFAGAFLQHGSIRLRDDSELYEAVLGERIPPPPRALQRCPIEDMVAALLDAFDRALDGRIQPGALTTRELKTARSRRPAAGRLRLRALAPSSRRPPRTADTQA